MKVLLAVDGSSFTERALQYLVSHPALLGREHEYLAFTAVPRIPPHAAGYLPHAVVEGYYSDEAEKVLAPVRHFASEHGLRISTEHGLGSAGESIAAFAERHSVDLIVMGSHGHSALANVVLGSVATAVLAMSRIPVLIVR